MTSSAASVKAWRLANPEKHRAWTLQWRKKNADRIREYRRQYDASRPGRHNGWHGITKAQYDTALAEQAGLCAICGGIEVAGCMRLSVDHDHKTDQFRGLLCRRCNIVLGLLEDNDVLMDTWVEQAHQYLLKSRT